MKRYNKNGQLETIMCNCCGKKLVVQHGIIREGCISIDHAWDYFSEKECYDELVSGFKIPVDREEQIEFL